MRILILFLSTMTFTSINHVESKFDIPGLRNAVKGFKNMCLKASGVSEELVAGTHRAEFPPERELMCYFKCLFQKMKIIKNGQFLEEAMTSQIKSLVVEDVGSILLESVERCAQKSIVEELCQTSYNFVGCMSEIGMEYYFLP